MIRIVPFPRNSIGMFYECQSGIGRVKVVPAGSGRPLSSLSVDQKIIVIHTTLPSLLRTTSKGLKL